MSRLVISGYRFTSAREDVPEIRASVMASSRSLSIDHYILALGCAQCSTDKLGDHALSHREIAQRSRPVISPPVRRPLRELREHTGRSAELASDFRSLGQRWVQDMARAIVEAV